MRNLPSKNLIELLDVSSLRKCMILKRLNRFVVEALAENKVIKLNIRNSGRLQKLLVKDFQALYKPKQFGKTSGYLIAIRVNDDYAIVDTNFQMTLWELLIDKELLPWLKGFKIKQRNVRLGESLVDYLLEKNDIRLLVEIKSATHVEDSIAMYPDAPTRRGRRHIDELAKLASRGFKTAVYFIAAHPHAKAFRIYREVDDELYQIALKAIRNGVDLKATKMFVTKNLKAMALTTPLPIIWH